MDLNETFELWKMVVTERVSASRLIYPSPCFVIGLHVEATDGDAVVDVHGYNGTGTGGEEKITFTAKGADNNYTPTIPMYFNKAFYAYLETNAASVTVQYIPLRARG